MNYFRVPAKATVDPSKLSITDLKNYKGADHQRLRRILSNCIKGKYYLLAPLGIYLISLPFVEVTKHSYLHGYHNKGGEVLELKTKLSDDDIRYNRELQKLRFLSEPNYANLNEDTDKVLSIKKAGGDINLHAPHDDRIKVVPHYKHI